MESDVASRVTHTGEVGGATQRASAGVVPSLRKHIQRPFGVGHRAFRVERTRPQPAFCLEEEAGTQTELSCAEVNAVMEASIEMGTGD